MGMILASSVLIGHERRGNTARQTLIHIAALAAQAAIVTASVAILAGQIDGQNTAVGGQSANADLLIGVTALDLGYSVLSSNTRPFSRVPGLAVIAA